MTILDTFSILFTSNASDVKKQMAEAEKSTKDFQAQIDNSDKAIGSLSTSLLKVGVEAISAFATFEGLKAGIKDAINFNAQLEKTSLLTNVSAKSLAVYDATFAQMGSNSGEFTGWLKSTASNIQLTSGEAKNAVPNLMKMADEIHNAGSETEALQKFRIDQKKWDLPDSFFFSMRRGSEAFKDIAEQQSVFINANDKTAAQGLELESSWKDVGNEFTSAFTTVQPVIEGVVVVVEILGAALKVILDLTMSVVYAFKLLAQLATFNFSGAADSLEKIGSSVGDAGKDAWNYSGAIAKRVDKDLAPDQEDADAEKDRDKKPVERSPFANQGSPANQRGKPKSESQKKTQQESQEFWQKQGYTPAQAAGLVANEERESGFNPNAVGDNGAAHGSFQWHGDRRKDIMKGTGIDVSNASHADQLKAAAWELKQRGDDKRIMATDTPEAAAAVVSRKFERPANEGGEAAIRGQLASKGYSEMMANAQSSVKAADANPLNSTPAAPAAAAPAQNISVGSITINSPTGDPADHARLFKEHLNGELSYVNANMNDGIKS